MSVELERRYRRLLAWYPADHRRRYEEEMIGVLLAGARPGQRHPGIREAANLVVSGAGLRLARAGAAITGPRWGDAAAALGLIGSLVLLTVPLRRLIGGLTWAWQTPDMVGFVGTPHPAFLASLGWAVVAAAALLGWRLAAALAAWATVLVQAVALGDLYPGLPVFVLNSWWLVVLGVTVAAALSVPTRARATRVLGRRATALLLGGVALTAAAPALDPLLANVQQSGDGYSVSLWPGGGGYLPGIFDVPPIAHGTGLAPLILYALAAVVLVAGVARIAPPVRRRLLALLAPAGAVLAVVRLGFGGYVFSSVRFNPPVLLAPEQWVVLTAVPLIAFLVAAAAVHRRERRLHLIRLGEGAEGT